MAKHILNVIQQREHTLNAVSACSVTAPHYKGALPLAYLPNGGSARFCTQCGQVVVETDGAFELFPTFVDDTAVDTQYSPTSSNAQSGTAVAGALKAGSTVETLPAGGPARTIIHGTTLKLDDVSDTLEITPSALTTLQEMTVLYSPYEARATPLIAVPQGVTLHWAGDEEPAWEAGKDYVIQLLQTSPTRIEARLFNAATGGTGTVDQTYTPTSPNPQSGTAVSEGLSFTNFRATLFQYPFCVATWSQFEEMNPHYLTDKIVFLPGLLAEPSSLTLPNAEYVMHKWPGGFAANSGPSQFPGGQLTTILAPNAKCIWVQPDSVNSQVKFSNYYAKRVVFYCASGFGFGVANGGFSWESYRFEGYDTKSMVCELVMPYQTSEVVLACPTIRSVANFPREWRIFLPSISTGVKLFTETPTVNHAVPPLSKESILYLLNHVRKAVFGSGGPYVFSLALAADYFDENGELIDEELKAKVTEMSANYTISFVKSNYYL